MRNRWGDGNRKSREMKLKVRCTIGFIVQRRRGDRNAARFGRCDQAGIFIGMMRIMQVLGCARAEHRKAKNQQNGRKLPQGRTWFHRRQDKSSLFPGRGPGKFVQ